MKNPFLRDDASYKRDLDVVGKSMRDYAKYIQLHTGKDFDTCLAFVKDEFNPNSETGLKDPKALIIEKDKNGDRVAKTRTFMQFLKRVENNQLLMAPSMTVYLPETVKESTHSQFLQEGVSKRKKVKHRMMQEEIRKEMEKAARSDGEQKYLKTNNNSYSGATASKATILHFKSTHSSLTSPTRTATSYANAANEKFLAGNRHYYNSEITKANLISLIQQTDLQLLERCCETFNLHYPTAEETNECVKESYSEYWSGPQNERMIQQMIEVMTPVERAAVVYVGDLYHLNKFNHELVMGFLRQLSQVGDLKHAVSDEEYRQFDGDIQIHATFVCFELVKGRDVNKLKDEDPAVWETVKATAAQAVHTLNSYNLLIEALWLTNNVPSSVYAFPSSVRKAVVVSDTDSTMFTCQYWVEQMFGKNTFSVEARQLVFSVVFLVSEIVMHVLAMQSANMGVSVKKLRLLAMKNEFYFAVMSMTTRSKHYYASQDAKEGLMYQQAKMEVKGVGLRDSKVPKEIMDDARNTMEELINTIKSEQLIDMRALLTKIGDTERDIIRTIEAGSAKYATSVQVKQAESYKKGEEASTYQQFLLWRDVFAPHFGGPKEPPYSAVKVSLKANNKTEIKEWCDSMENKALGTALRQWLMSRQKNNLTTLFIPDVVVATMGIPSDIIKGIDKRKMVFNCTSVYYLMLEPLGSFLQDKRLTRLVSDFH